MSNKKVILSKIVEKLVCIDSELKDGYDNVQNDEMVIEEVLNNNLPTIMNTKSISCYRDYHYLEKALIEIRNTLKIIKDEIELEDFFKTGNNFDTDKLRQEFKVKNLKKKFPDFKLEKYLKILNNPILEFENFNGEIIVFDEFWVKKMMITINQMIFNEMDAYILSIGREGAGKSCWSSQQILYFYEFFKLVGLIKYAYDVQKMFFIDIMSFLEENMTQDKDDFFKIECLDEGNDLNRSSFREESNQRFKFEMRSERKMLRVVLINMQQIGELDTSISLSRINFIYNCKMRSDVKTGTLIKGDIDFYIIPRGNSIFSNKNKKVLSRNEILNAFATKLDRKRDYYIDLPNDMIVHSFKFEGKWGFDFEKYSDHVKDSMVARKFKDNLKMTDIQAYILLKKLYNFIELGTFDRKASDSDNKMYLVLHKFFKKLDSYFDSNPERLMAVEKKYKVSKVE